MTKSKKIYIVICFVVLVVAIIGRIIYQTHQPISNFDQRGIFEKRVQNGHQKSEVANVYTVDIGGVSSSYLTRVGIRENDAYEHTVYVQNKGNAQTLTVKWLDEKHIQIANKIITIDKKETYVNLQ